MREYTRILFVALFLCAMILAGGTVSSRAQIFAVDKGVNKSLAKTVREKIQNNRLALLTPEEAAKILPDVPESMFAGADPCDTALSIAFGETINGQLTTGDCHLEDNSYADFYVFNGMQGQQVTITMNSSDFDTYLGLANEDGSFVVEDDNGGGGTNSRIVAMLPQTGLYVILANSAFPNQTGNYSLNLQSTMPCTYVLEPTSANVPAVGGTFTFSVVTQDRCQWGASPINSAFITTNSSGVGSGTVTYTVEVNGNETPRVGIIRIGAQNFTVNQAAAVCNFTLTPSTINISAASVSGSFTVTSSAPGCYWRADSNNLFISYSGGGGSYGSGTVNYTIATNNGAARTGRITVRDQVFTVNQAGQDCSFSISPTSITAPSTGQTGTVTVTTQPGCAWRVSRSEWILIDTIDTTGTGTFSYTILPNGGTVSRSYVIPIFGSPYRVEVTQTGTLFRTAFDFDGDGKSDISVFRPSVGGWYILQSSNSSFLGVGFGFAGDLTMPADFDGDGKTDIAVFRPDSGTWYLQRSTAGFIGVAFGQSGDIPVAADYDGDGKSDIAVFRPSTGSWYRLNSSTGQPYGVAFGAAEDIPTVGDFDGDGKSDIAVFRPSTGNWYRLNSSTGQFYGIAFGQSGDRPVAADYDGDGKTDIAVFRYGVWYLLRSRDGFLGTQFGTATDKPVAADYDGDGKTDIAVYRDGVWYLLQTSNGFTGVQFGAVTDKPIPHKSFP